MFLYKDLISNVDAQAYINLDTERSYIVNNSLIKATNHANDPRIVDF